MNTALTTCMSAIGFFSTINVDNLHAKVKSLESVGSVDPTSNLANDFVYVFAGTKDTTVKNSKQIFFCFKTLNHNS